MSIKTKIQWCDSIANPVMGCVGCELWPTIGQLVTAIGQIGNPNLNCKIRSRLEGMLPTDVYHNRKALAQEFADPGHKNVVKDIASAIASIYRCYAGILHLRHGSDDTQPLKITNCGYASKFETPRLFPGRMSEAAGWGDLRGARRLGKPWMDGLPRLIFVSDMGDALSAGVQFAYLRTEIIDNVCSRAGQRHIWLWLSKRPNRMAEFSEWLLEQGIRWPDHLVPMTSVTSNKTVGRVEALKRVQSKYRGLSVEPLWAPVNLPLDGISWVIVGGESGPYSRPFDLEWARNILWQCRREGTAPFIKQLGSRPAQAGAPLVLRNGHGSDWSEWPSDIRVREFPRQWNAAGKPRPLSTRKAVMAMAQAAKRTGNDQQPET